MKKIFSLLVVLTLVFTLSGCNTERFDCGSNDGDKLYVLNWGDYIVTDLIDAFAVALIDFVVVLIHFASSFLVIPYLYYVIYYLYY